MPAAPVDSTSLPSCRCPSAQVSSEFRVVSKRFSKEALRLSVERGHTRIIYRDMARFELALTRRTDPTAGSPIARRYVLGRFGAIMATVAAALLAIIVVTAALVLGYFIAGIVIAAMLVAILVALLRSAFRALRN